MTTIYRKTVWSEKTVPHFVETPQDATHRYLPAGKDKWRYVEARNDREFLAWGHGWLSPQHSPQKKHAGIWKELPL